MKVYRLVHSNAYKAPGVGLQEKKSPYFLRLRLGLTHVRRECVLCKCMIQKGHRRWKVVAESAGPYVCEGCVSAYVEAQAST